LLKFLVYFDKVSKLHGIELEDAELVQEDERDANGTHELDARPIPRERRRAQRSVVGVLASDERFRQNPTDKHACKQATRWQKNVTRDKVEPIEQRFAADLQAFPSCHAERAKYAYKSADECDPTRSRFAIDFELLVHESRTYFVYRNQRSQCSHREKHVERDANEITYDGNLTECFVKHVWQRDKDQRWTAIWINANRECRWKNDQSSKNSDESIDDADLNSRLDEISLLAEIRRIRAKASHTDAQRIECLSHSAEKHVARKFGEVGMEHKSDAPPSVWQQTSNDNQYNEQNKQRRHHQF